MERNSIYAPVPGFDIVKVEETMDAGLEVGLCPAQSLARFARKIRIRSTMKRFDSIQIKSIGRRFESAGRARIRDADIHRPRERTKIEVIVARRRPEECPGHAVLTHLDACLLIRIAPASHLVDADIVSNVVQNEIVEPEHDRTAKAERIERTRDNGRIGCGATSLCHAERDAGIAPFRQHR